MSGQPYMQFYPGDFISDTMHLSATEIGQYMLILCAMWKAGGYVPDNPGKLRRIARGNVSPEVLALLTERNGALTQKRLMLELDRAQKKCEARRLAGEAGNRAKALKRQGADHANGNALGSHLSDSDSDGSLKGEPMARRQSGACLPPDWQPDTDLIAYGLKLGLTTEQVEASAVEMKGWAAANRNRAIARKADWSQAFQGWLRRDAEKLKRRAPASSNQKRGESVLQTFDRLFPDSKETDHDDTTNIIELKRSGPASFN
jgi:uncharacterized protein YdaU (DUF1376 family)